MTRIRTYIVIALTALTNLFPPLVQMGRQSGPDHQPNQKHVNSGTHRKSQSGQSGHSFTYQKNDGKRHPNFRDRKEVA